MLVGPMKRRVVLTGVISAIIPIIILGVLGFFLFRHYNDQIAELEQQSAVVDKYVLKEDVLANHVITESDIELRGVKAVSAPKDSYAKADKDKLVGRRLKISASANVILSESMFFEDDKVPTIDLRLQEFNMITLPSDLVENDYIDVRVRFPSGEDYSVLVGKRVESYSNDTIFIKLTEDEILTMGSAIIEAYILDGTKLYANKYVDPANQLFEYTNVDYVARYSEAVEALLSARTEELVAEYLLANPEATEEEATARVSARESDLSVAEIANRIGLSAAETSAIKDALQANNTAVLNEYRNKRVTTEKKIVRTYPVKENVLNLIKSNPNILEEVKANFDTEAILAQRMNMPDTTITEFNEYADKVRENLANEIQTQKEERVTYLRSLLNNQ
ncbi:MAG: SAF domain-containing protein [Clostridia bacterium]|nr:SAF domain-containing protein [Clostridia bacterium]